MNDPTQMELALGGIMQASADPEKVMTRDAPTPEASRAAGVKEWQTRVLAAREYWTKKAFTRMASDMRFASGAQWQANDPTKALPDEDADGNYVANITLRHIRSRTASLYGKNPRIVARRKERLLSTIWDGTQVQLQMAQMIMQQGQMAGQAGMPLAPQQQAMMMQAMQIMQEAEAVRIENARMDRIGKTLQILFEHEIDEQPLNFKVQMKAVVRRALTTGVAYAKLDFQRVMDLPPEVDRQIADLSQQLATIEQLAADQADGEFDEASARADQLRNLIRSLADGTDRVTVREGLAISYPDSTAIIPDMNCKQLRGFVGSEWVAEEFFLTGDQVKQIYGVDVSGTASLMTGEDVRAKNYTRSRHAEYRPSDSTVLADGKEQGFHCVWEIYSKLDGLVYVVCDGWPEYLVEPARPNVRLERFWPWFPFAVNECYDDDTVFPPSDVQLMRDMQRELNRARQGLREHRRAARPRWVTRKGALADDDKDKLETGRAFDLVELESLADQQKISDVLDAMPNPGVDPNLYDTSAAYEDYLRTLGQQEANLGGTSGATATEASIAESSRSSDASSTVDDLDEFLGEFARAAGQILLTECSAEKVKRVVGPGAIWPEMSADEIAQELYLDVEAASTGRPNRSAEIQAAQMMFPLLMQLPNVNPEWMAREMLRRMDDRMDLTDAFLPNTPSVQSLNALTTKPPTGPAAGGMAADPAAQGGQGAFNAPSTVPAQANAAPRPGRPPMVDPNAPPPNNPNGQPPVY